MSKLKILIADDDCDIVASMHMLLKNRGHDVVTAGSGEEALVKYGEFKPDIIFLDLMMEKFDSGVMVCRKIRETDKKVRIYLISAVSDKASDLAEIEEMGFNGSMSKPLTSENLIGLID